MARRPRVSVEGGIYHVYTRFASDKPVFFDTEEAVELIDLMRETKARNGWHPSSACGRITNLLCLTPFWVPKDGVVAILLNNVRSPEADAIAFELLKTVYESP